MSYTVSGTQPATVSLSQPVMIVDPAHKPTPGSTVAAPTETVAAPTVAVCVGKPVAEPMGGAGFAVAASLPAVSMAPPAPAIAPFSVVGGTSESNYNANLETFANNEQPFFLLAKDYEPLTDWYKYPCLPIPPSVDGIITIFDASGAHQLKSIEGNLYYDDDLLAKAGDIQDIGDWALYPALANINVSGNDIDSANVINGVTVNATTVNATDFVGGDVSAGTVLCSSVATTSVVSDTIGANSALITDISATTVEATTFIGDLSAALVSATDVSAGTVTANDVNATDVSAGTVTATQVNATDVSAGTVTATQFNGGDISAANITLTGDISGNASFFLTGYSQTLDLSNGAVVLSTSGSNLLINGQPVSTGTGGNVSQWATFPAVAPVTGGANPLLLGNGTNSCIQDFSAISTTSESFFDIGIDRGLDLNNARFRVNCENGTGGLIEMTADSDVTDNIGGFIDIQALSAGSITPTALSRINAEAATLTLSAGALGPLAFVPGSVNLLSGAGTGIQLLTGTGVINIASGVAATMSAGAGIFLDGGTQDVNIAAGQSLFVDRIAPRTAATVEIQNGIRTDLIIGDTGVGTAIPNIACNKIIPVTPAPKTAVPNLDIISPTSTIVFGVSGDSITADATGSTFRASYDFYVAPNGNDTTGTGSPSQPFLTVGRALTAAAGVASGIEVSINLFAGTYTENITVTRPNTYITSYSTSGARQPTNLTGNITVGLTTATTFSVGFTGLTTSGSITLSTNTTPDVTGVYTFTDCLINGVLGSPTLTFSETESTSHTLIIENCRFNTGNAASSDIGFLLTGGGTQILNCIIQHSGDGACISSNDNNNLVIRNTTITSATISATAAPIIQYNNAVATATEITFSTLRYTSGVTDTGGNKCCIQFNNAGTVTAILAQLFLSCVGAVTGTPNIEVIQKTGAGAVNLTYGNLECVGAPRFLAPAITETPTGLTPQGRYASFSSSATQTVTAANTVTAITFNTTEVNTGGYTLSGASIIVSRAGLYEFIPSFQFHKSGGGATDIFFWAQTSPDGVTWTDVPRSSSTVELAGPSAPVLGTLALSLDLAANDRLRFVFASADTTAQVLATAAIAAPYVRPANPSVIVTVKLLS